MNLTQDEFNKLSPEELATKLSQDSITVTTNPVVENLLTIPRLSLNLGSTPVPPVIPPSASQPSDLLNLANWTLMLPIAKAGSPTSPENLYVVDAQKFPNISQFFKLNDTKDGVVFTVRADGVHSSGSQYPRSELREMVDANWTKASWSNTSGVHILEGTYSLNHALVKRKQFVFAQTHDANSDVWEAAYDDGKLVVLYNNKANSIVLEPNYVLGTKFTFKVIGTAGSFTFSYNGTLVPGSIPCAESGLYFKTGQYLQSNVAKWQESPDAWGQTTIYALTTSHQ